MDRQRGERAGGRDAKDRDVRERDADRDRPGRADRERDTDRDRPGRADRERDADRPGRADRERPDDRGRAGRDERGRPDRDGGERRSSITSLSTQQQTSVRESFTRRRIQPVRNVNFSISVGVNVPRNVRLYPVPVDVVRTVPEYRGYQYTIIEDEIVIIEPRTRRIVEVVGRSGGGGGAAAAGPSGRSRLTLSEQGRSRVRRLVTTTRTAPASTIELREGMVLPGSVEILTFPDEVVTEVPDLRTYEYVIVGNRVGIVERQSRTVVEIVE
jgi:hypothetical protein